MRYVTVFQIGDVHYPDHQNRDADLKDRKLATEVVAATTAQELQASTRALLGALADHPAALVTFAGDLTSQGNLAGYEACVSWLSEALKLGPGGDVGDDRLQVVPGNHDVDRNLSAAATGGDILDKFVPLSETWRARGLDVIATHQPRIVTVGADQGNIITYGLNSCIGCGERRILPPGLRSAIEEALSDAGLEAGKAGDALEDAISAHAEIIDAPAFHEQHVDDVYSAVKAQDLASVAVLVAHHNLLQQAQPRFDVYTDLMNSGLVRARLSSLDVPVIYLHGHIHDDPVELVTQAAPDAGQIICISAPEFRSGFNRIDIVFSSDGTPVGCIVHRYRVRLHGGTSMERPIRIRFRSYESVISNEGMEVLRALVDHPSCSSLTDLRRVSPGLDEYDDAKLAAAIDEVEWLELVEVLNRERPHQAWKIRAVTRRE